MPSNQTTCNDCGCTPNPLDSGNWESESTARSALAAPTVGTPAVNNSPSGGTCQIKFTVPCVVMSWSEGKYIANGNLEHNCKAEDITWSLDAGESGATMNPPGQVNFGPDGAEVTVKASCGDQEVSMKLVYVKAELLYVLFVNAHTKGAAGANIVRDEAASYVEDGMAFPFKGWRRKPDGTGECFPVAHTFTDDVTLNVQVRITPAGLSFEITGQGLAGQFGGALLWKRIGLSSIGAPQLVPNLMPIGKLPQSAGISKGNIGWRIKVMCCTNPVVPFETSTIPEKSGEHEIFRTFNLPNIAVPDVAPPTLIRLRAVCGFAEGATTGLEAVHKLSQQWPFVPVGPGYDPEGSDWRIFEGKPGDCDDHSVSFIQGVKLLGLAGVYVKINATTDGTCADDEQTKTVIVEGIEVTAVLMFGTRAGAYGDTGAQVGINAYQGVAHTEGLFWNIYSKANDRVQRDTACKMYRYVVQSVLRFQYWFVPSSELADYVVFEAQQIPPAGTCD